MEQFVFFNELDKKEPRFDDAYECLGDEKVDFYIVKSKDEYYAIYANGEQKKLPPICHSLCFVNGLGKIRVWDKFGFVDSDGNTVIEPKYVNVHFPYEGLIAVTEAWEEGVSFLDMQGNEVIPPKFRTSISFNEGLAGVMVQTERGYKWGFIDKKGEMVIKPKYSYVSSFHNGFAEVRIGNRVTYINKQGKEIRYLSKRRPEFKCGRMSFCKNRRHGFINENNEIVIPAQYTMVKDFYEGLAGVKRKGEKWGFIDTDGNTVIEPQFDDVAYFSEGLCAVRIGENWGYIDKTGNVVIKPRFEEAGEFSNLCAEAGENYKVGIIDKNGNYLIEPMFDIVRPFDYEGCRIVKIGEKYDIIKVRKND